MEEILFRAVKIKDRLPNFSERIIFLDEGYKGTFMSEYIPDEMIPLKKGKFIEMKDCKIAQDFLLGNFTHWLERIPNKDKDYEIVTYTGELIKSVKRIKDGVIFTIGDEVKTGVISEFVTYEDEPDYIDIRTPFKYNLANAKKV